MRPRTLVGFAALGILAAGPAHAVTLTFSTDFATYASSYAAATNAEAVFLSALPGVTTESFQSYAAGTTVGPLGSPFATSVGTFEQIDKGVTSGSCVSLNNCTGLAILNGTTSPFTGRFPMTEGSSDRVANWLDSNDSREMLFEVTPGYRAVGFYITDANDVGGLLEVRGVDGSLAAFDFINIFGSSLTDGRVSYISLKDPDGIDSIRFLSNAPGDGFGIDRVSIGDPVPEPGTLLLLGAGLLGLGRRCRSKQQ